MIRKLDIEEAKKLYRDYIDEDFPNDERPNYNHYVKLLESEEFIPYSYEEENKMKAYIICIEKGDNVLISHLAVLKEYRGQGIGTKSLNEMKFFFEKIIYPKRQFTDNLSPKAFQRYPDRYFRSKKTSRI